MVLLTLRIFIFSKWFILGMSIIPFHQFFSPGSVLVTFGSHDSNRRSNRDFFNVQSTELIVDPVLYLQTVICVCPIYSDQFIQFCFFMPNGHTSVVGFNPNSIVFHNQYRRENEPQKRRTHCSVS